MPRPARSWPVPVLALLIAVAAGLAVAELLLTPPMSELFDLSIYFAASGAVTLVAGWLLIRWVDRRVSLSLHRRALVIAAAGPVVALANVFFVAQLMFVSTGHDLRLLIALIAFSGVMALVFASWSAAITTRRVERVHLALQQLEQGNGVAWADAGSHADEIDGLGERMTALAGRLVAADRERDAIDRQRRELTAAISHDLRTPLASIQAMVEALNDSVVKGEDVDRYHGAIARDVERLSRMVDDLLELAQLDSGATRLSCQLLAVDEIAAEVVSAMQVQAANAGVELRLEVAGAIPPTPLDGARIERALTNLVRNALDHTPRGGEVVVSVKSAAECVLVDVTDTGTGVPPEDEPHIWERFYRGDPARTRAQGSLGGTGMGLAIVRGFVEAHGGTVAMKPRKGSGSVFTMRLPRGGSA